MTSTPGWGMAAAINDTNAAPLIPSPRVHEHVVELQGDLPEAVQILLILVSLASIVCFCVLIRVVLLDYLKGGFSSWNKVTPMRYLDSSSGYILMFFGLMYLHPLLLGLPAAMALLMMALHGEDSARFGLRRLGIPATFGTGLWVCLALMPVMSAIVWLQTQFFMYFGIPTIEQDPVSRLHKKPMIEVLLVLVPVVLIVAPVLEEFLFRGVIHPVLKFRFKLGWFLYIKPLLRRYPFLRIHVTPLLPSQPHILGSTLAASFVTAILFALIHDNLRAFIPLLLLGFVLSLVYEYTGSIATSVALHAVFNGCSAAHVILLRVLKDFGFIH